MVCLQQGDNDHECHTGDMTVAESHDIALALQHKVEALEDVERYEPRL
jgi:hypothetical protein